MTSFLSLVFLTVALASPLLGEQISTPAPVKPRVQVESGDLEGYWANPEGSVAGFKSIPFAAPPVGDLRWKPPQAPVPWQGTRRATDFGPACPQPESLRGWVEYITTTLGGDPSKQLPYPPTSEDCLQLNIWTANLDGTPDRPVMVWIHGGAFMGGWASTPWYSGRSLANKGAVVVTLNYRLGALGFMAHPALTEESPERTSGNYGLLDIIAALRWVRRNIAAFGGDPDNVTIFGESSGGSAVVYLMASPLGKGLFHRAIGQSFMEPYVVGDKPETAAFAGRLDLDKAEKYGTELISRATSAKQSTSLESLRSLAPEAIVEASVVPDARNLFVPNVDGWVLLEAPANYFRQGRQHDVPFLLGVTADEGTLLLNDPTWQETIDYEKFVRDEFPQGAEQLLGLYPAPAPEEIRSVRLGWFQDGCVTAARYLAASMNKTKSPAYLYVFSRVGPGPGAEALGAFHGSEIPFVFNSHLPAVWPIQPGDDRLSEIIGNYWVQFAKTGDPNAPGLPSWAPYKRGEDRYMDLKHEPKEMQFSPEQVRRLNTLEQLFWQ